MKSKNSTYSGHLSLDDTIRDVAERLERDDEVTVWGFGKFYRVTLKESAARNPATGEKVAVKERKTVRFRLARSLRESDQSR